MIRSCTPRPPQPLPLLIWQDMQELEQLRAQHKILSARTEALPPHAHRRIELEVRLKALTAHILIAEQDILTRMRGGA